MRIVGVDPGVTGALAFFEDGKVCEIKDMPEYDGMVSGLQVGDWLTEWNPHYVVIEKQHAMPKNGSIAGFKQGQNFGVVCGAAAALRHPLVMMNPQEWKQANGLIGKDKNASRGVALQVYPHMAAYLSRVKDHNRAEAMLIGRAFIAKYVQERNAS